MTCLCYQNGFLIMTALVCMVIDWIELTVNHDIIYQIVIIHQVTILHGLSTLREYWVCVEIINGFDLWVRPKGSYEFLMNWVTINRGWWQQIFSTKALWYLMVWDSMSP